MTNENVRKELRGRLDGVQRSCITPFLLGLGYSRRGRLYFKKAGDVTYLLEIKLARLPEEGELKFTVDCGVHVKGFFSSYAGISKSEDATMRECCCFTSIGMLSPSHKEMMWRIHENNEDVDCLVGKDVCDSVVKFVIPFFNELKDAISVAEFLVSSASGNAGGVHFYGHPPSTILKLTFAAHIYAINGDIRKAEAAAVDARTVADRKGIDFDIDKLISKLNAISR